MIAEKNLSNLESILTEIERLDRASGGKLRQASDRESFDVACRIERQMQQSTPEKLGALSHEPTQHQ